MPDPGRVHERLIAVRPGLLAQKQAGGDVDHDARLAEGYRPLGLRLFGHTRATLYYGATGY
jgi:hypothetical protein